MNEVPVPHACAASILQVAPSRSVPAPQVTVPAAATHSVPLKVVPAPQVNPSVGTHWLPSSRVPPPQVIEPDATHWPPFSTVPAPQVSPDLVSLHAPKRSAKATAHPLMRATRHQLAA